MLFQNRYRIESTRLKGWDYSTPGYYFVTICAEDHRRYFGRINNGKMTFSPTGDIADRYFRAIPDHFPNAVIDTHVVMPDHVHGIIRIIASNNDPVGDVGDVVETQNVASLLQNPQQNPRQINRSSGKSITNRFGPQSHNISSMVRGYKTGVKKWCVMNNIPFAWQPRFHDHIIRNERELFLIRRYIKNNPSAWDQTP